MSEEFCVLWSELCRLLKQNPDVSRESLVESFANAVVPYWLWKRMPVIDPYKEGISASKAEEIFMQSLKIVMGCVDPKYWRIPDHQLAAEIAKLIAKGKPGELKRVPEIEDEPKFDAFWIQVCRLLELAPNTERFHVIDVFARKLGSNCQSRIPGLQNYRVGSSDAEDNERFRNSLRIVLAFEDPENLRIPNRELLLAMIRQLEQNAMRQVRVYAAS